MGGHIGGEGGLHCFEASVGLTQNAFGFGFRGLPLSDEQYYELGGWDRIIKMSTEELDALEESLKLQATQLDFHCVGQG